MSNTQVLADIEQRASGLSTKEQLWLIERLAQNLRRLSPPGLLVTDEHLAAMAADPDIQREIREIDEEFLTTETDGLEGL